jgi:DNA-binding NtrC family response regulator
MKIFVVDDHPDFCELLRRLLSNMGHNVHAFTSADDLMSFLSSKPAEGLVLTDAVMPHKSGFELLRDLRKSNPTLKSILMSGHSRSDLDDCSVDMKDVLFWRKGDFPKLLALIASLQASPIATSP